MPEHMRMLYLDLELKSNALESVIIHADLRNPVSGHGKNLLFSCFSVLLSEAIDKPTIDDLLLDLIINNKLLIEMPIENNLQENFTLHL